MTERKFLTPDQSRHAEDFLPLMDLTLWKMLTGNDVRIYAFNSTFTKEALWLIRYADERGGGTQELLHPETERPITLSDLGFTKDEIKEMGGETAGQWIHGTTEKNKRRIQYIPEVALALYRLLNKE
jgi:hypothetical protein